MSLGCVIFEMLALDTPHADKLPPLDASIEEDENASYNTTDYENSMGTRPNLPDYINFDELFRLQNHIWLAISTLFMKVFPSQVCLLNNNDAINNGRGM